MPAERRSPATRRSRIAARSHRAEPAGRLGTAISPEPPSGVAVRPGQRWALQPDAGSTPSGPPSRRSMIATLVALGAVIVIMLGLAAWFRGEANQLAGSAPASNAALVDAAATAEVAGQVRDAVQRVYSYDFADLDENERRAEAVVTGPFAESFADQFARVREEAPEQQAVVVATVLNLGVKVLDGDRAIVVVFIDQQASQGVEAVPLRVAGRLVVTAERVGGEWKIAGVEPF